MPAAGQASRLACTWPSCSLALPSADSTEQETSLLRSADEVTPAAVVHPQQASVARWPRRASSVAADAVHVGHRREALHDGDIARAGERDCRTPEALVRRQLLLKMHTCTIPAKTPFVVRKSNHPPGGEAAGCCNKPETYPASRTEAHIHPDTNDTNGKRRSRFISWIARRQELMHVRPSTGRQRHLPAAKVPPHLHHRPATDA